MEIIDLPNDNSEILMQVANLLVTGFAQDWPGNWPDLESALVEVQQSLQTDRLSRIAINEDGEVLGWIGGISMYNGNVWELHPLIVKPNWQGQGIGRSLVLDLENQVKQRGGLTLWLGTDDENNLTSLSNVNLYSHLWEHIAKIQTKIPNLRRHPYEFYQKLGFVIVGVMPDANGIGKPDIYMAKSLQPISD